MKNLAAAAVLCAALAPAAFAHEEPAAPGRPADARKAARTIRIEMSDAMRFSPDTVHVKLGEIVRLIPVNRGQVMHEMVLGTMDELKKHAEMMRRHPHMQHEEEHMAHVAPGKSGEIAWQFTRAGEFFFACLLPGHFEAGMIGRIVVEP